MTGMTTPATGPDAAAINQRSYDTRRTDTSLIRPERFNTWPPVRSEARLLARQEREPMHRRRDLLERK
jgi:hypothetical protein